MCLPIRRRLPCHHESSNVGQNTNSQCCVTSRKSVTAYPRPAATTASAGSAYVEKKTSQGHSKLETIRCLKRYLASAVYYLLIPGQQTITPNTRHHRKAAFLSGEHPRFSTATPSGGTRCARQGSPSRCPAKARASTTPSWRDSSATSRRNGSASRNPELSTSFTRGSLAMVEHHPHSTAARLPQPRRVPRPKTLHRMRFD